MYDIRQFKPALILVVLLGLSGYALAAESPGLWLFAVLLVLTNVYLTRQGQFRPIPRVFANAVTLIAFAYAFLQVRTHAVDSPILAIGQFLVLLQVVKVWEQRANRDYAQLLVLSLLLMVAAAISTASLAFGVLFVGYLLTSLYCCLLFHLKVETDAAQAARLPTTAVDAAPVAAATAGGVDAQADRDRSLSGSMRRLTGLISAYALVSAVAVFLFFPRSVGAGLFGQFAWKPRQTLTGFSEQVNFQQVAKITQNDDQVGTVRITRDGKPLQFAGPLLMRGYTDDYYSGGDNTNDRGAYQWSHDPGTRSADRWLTMVDHDNGTWRPQPSPTALPFRRDAGDDDGPIGGLHQDVELSPTGTRVMFALPGLERVRIEGGLRNKLRLEYSNGDQTVRASDELTQPVRYGVDSTDDLGNEPPPDPIRSVIDPEIRRFARRPAVTGGLADARAREVAARPDGGDGYVSPLDHQIATNIEAYLRRNYAYTLDLTNVARVQGRDPMVAFLTDFKEGHCEYFAGAMTLLCQSLGMQARLVVGFKVDDFNGFGRYYTIRQSQAHAWVEVRTADRGWVSFDPTGGHEATQASVSVWQRTKNLFDFMEYTWQRAVISYNADNRENLIQNVDARLSNSTIHGATFTYRLRDKLEALEDRLTNHLVTPVMVLLVAVLVGIGGWVVVDRYRLRRRARRIGLDDLPPDDQARLLRQLAFYDGLVQLLARHQIARPPHLTPMEFSRTLSFLPANAYDTIGRLTDVFYRIRYGGADLDDGRQRRLVGVVDRLEGMMPVEREL